MVKNIYLVALTLVLFCSSFGTATAAERMDGDFYSPDQSPIIYRIRAFVTHQAGSRSYSASGLTFVSGLTGHLLEENRMTGFDVGITYFPYDKFAVELSAGIINSGNANITSFIIPVIPGILSGGEFNISEGVGIQFISAATQYHPAPYGNFRPYLGAGYYYGFTDSKSSTVSFDNVSGPFFELGADWWFRKNAAVNFGVKKMLMTLDMDMTKTIGENFGAELEVDPTVFMIGLTIRR